MPRAGPYISVLAFATTTALFFFGATVVERHWPFAARSFLLSALTRSPQPSCPNSSWEDGEWVKRPGPHPELKDWEDVYTVSGFTGCNITHDIWKRLGNDDTSQWDWRARISTYDWKPSGGCAMAPFDAQSFILRLIRRGGWAMVGDSTAERQFYSLACMLHPYVRVAPIHWEGWDWEAGWPQYLYLNTDEPWVKQVIATAIPPGYNAEATPLVSFHRADVLFGQRELADMAAAMSGLEVPIDLTSFWTKEFDFVTAKSSQQWLGAFDLVLPAGRVDTLVVNSGAYWLPAIFAGLDGDLPEILRLWRVSMTLLTARMVKMLENDETKHRTVIFRSATPGHKGCITDSTIRDGGPLRTAPRLTEEHYNWKTLPRMNDILEEIIRAHNHPRLHFLRLDRPGALRPDAHSLEDCLHFAIGAGVLEDWNRYIDHFVRWEVDYGIGSGAGRR